MRAATLCRRLYINNTQAGDAINIHPSAPVTIPLRRPVHSGAFDVEVIGVEIGHGLRHMSATLLLG